MVVWAVSRYVGKEKMLNFVGITKGTLNHLLGEDDGNNGEMRS